MPRHLLGSELMGCFTAGTSRCISGKDQQL
jgi:hypothetical protein